MDYFVHFLLFGELVFTCHILRPNARSSGDLFWTYGTFWLLFLNTPAHVDLLSISTTYSWPSLYTSQFYVLFCIFTSPWWAYHYMGDISCITRARYFGDLFCTHTSSFVTYSELFDGLFWTHISPCWHIFYKYLLPILYWFLWPNLFVLFSLETIYLLEIFYDVHVPVMSYSVHIPYLCDLFFTYRTFWILILCRNIPSFYLFSTSTTTEWPSLYTYLLW